MNDTIVILNSVSEVKCSIGDGRFLQVKDVQRNGIRMNMEQEFNKLAKAEVPVSEEIQNTPVTSEVQPEVAVVPKTPVTNTEFVPISEIPSVVEAPQIIETPIVPEIPVAPVEDTPVFTTLETAAIPEVSVNEEVVVEQPVIASTPVVDSEPVIAQPQVDEPTQNQGVEIVSEQKVEASDYDKLIAELNAVDQECNQKIIDINAERASRKQAILNEHKQIIEAERAQILEFTTRAKEHLKNAQAAEEIATIAHQNAMNNMANAPQSMSVQNDTSFPEPVLPSDVPSLDSAPVLTKIA